jgi:serine/threonine protein kinase
MTQHSSGTSPRPYARAPLRSVTLLSSRLTCRVDGLLGEGGQGRVYHVTSEDGAELALKWYHPEWTSRDQWETLRTLVGIGPPAPSFLWPIDLATAGGGGQFGYVMRIRDPRFHEMFDLLRRLVTPGFRTLATIGMNLASAFLELHTRGLCYRDISWGNVFFDPLTGDVLICDNDNVGVDGAKTSIAGTRLFMAPEVVRGEAAPSTKTDRYSLAVLLFMILMIHHPLLGRRELEVPCLDAAGLDRLLVEQPTFIFDPQDASNRPIPGEHDNALAFWPIYPQFIRDLFTRAFTTGLHDAAQGRVTEGEWRAAMVRLRDATFRCRSCGQENFFGPGARRCCNPHCRKDLPVPPRLVLGGHEIVLDRETLVFPHHLSGHRYDFGTPLAEVREHPQFDAIGLTNLSGRNWIASSPGREPQEVPPLSSVHMLPGLRIDFGTVTGTVI